MAWWPPEVPGDEAGRWLREFVRALFSFPDPRAAAGGHVTLTEAEPAPGSGEPQERESDG